MANILVINPVTGLPDLVNTSSGGSGDVVGPASSTDNALVRFDSTTGKLLQNSTVTLSDTGAVFNQVTSAITIPLVLKGAAAQTANLQEWQNSGGTAVAFVKPNGILQAAEFKIATDLTGFNNDMFSIPTYNTEMVWNSGVSNSAWRLSGTNNTRDFLSLFQININKATNRGLLVKGFTAQSANLLEFRDVSDSTLLSITSNAVISTPDSATSTRDINVQTGIPSAGTRGEINLVSTGINLLDSNALFIRNDYIDSYWLASQVGIVIDSSIPNDNGNLFIGSTDVSTGTSHSVTLFSGNGTSGANSGIMEFASGAAAGAGGSGIVEMFSGDVVDGISGSINIYVGAVTGTGSKGKINLGADTINLLDSAQKLRVALDVENWWWGAPTSGMEFDSGSSGQAFTFQTSDASSISNETNYLIIGTGSNRVVGATGITGGIVIGSGTVTDPTASADTGTTEIFSASNAGTGKSGGLRIYTGDTVSNDSGDNIIYTGGTSGGGKSGALGLFTGSNSAGGDTGNIRLFPGTTSGVRGYIHFDSLVAVLPVGTSDPSTSYPNGSCYYNTATDNIRVLRGGTWRGILLV